MPFVTLDRQHGELLSELRAAFERVVGQSGFILGAEVEAFEAEFAGYCVVRHCVGVASGTAALNLALQAAGVGPGDEVIIPGHTFIASALGVLHAGATPVFADVDQGTGVPDPESVAAVLSSRTVATCPCISTGTFYRPMTGSSAAGQPPPCSLTAPGSTASTTSIRSGLPIERRSPHAWTPPESPPVCTTPPAAHRHPAFDGLPAESRPMTLPAVDAWAAEELSLPMGAELTPEEVQRVVVELGYTK